jgi:hypothetical protein
MPESPPITLRCAAAVEAVQALMVATASVFAMVNTAAGRSYQLASGVALSLIGAGCAVVLVLVAAGLARGRRWSRTPALLTQLFVGIVGIYLIQGHRLDWGVPSVALAVAGLAALLAPPSLRVLTGQEQRPGEGRPPGATRRRSGRP